MIEEERAWRFCARCDATKEWTPDLASIEVQRLADEYALTVAGRANLTGRDELLDQCDWFVGTSPAGPDDRRASDRETAPDEADLMPHRAGWVYLELPTMWFEVRGSDICPACATVLDERDDAAEWVARVRRVARYFARTPPNSHPPRGVYDGGYFGYAWMIEQRLLRPTPDLSVPWYL